jgi:hypothetical protein
VRRDLLHRVRRSMPARSQAAACSVPIASGPRQAPNARLLSIVLALLEGGPEEDRQRGDSMVPGRGQGERITASRPWGPAGDPGPESHDGVDAPGSAQDRQRPVALRPGGDTMRSATSRYHDHQVAEVPHSSQDDRGGDVVGVRENAPARPPPEDPGGRLQDVPMIASPFDGPPVAAPAAARPRSTSTRPVTRRPQIRVRRPSRAISGWSSGSGARRRE